MNLGQLMRVWHVVPVPLKPQRRPEPTLDGDDEHRQSEDLGAATN